MGGEIHVPAVKPYAASTSFAKGDMVVLPTGSFAMYQAVTGGKTGASSTPSGTGSSIADGTVTWRYVGLHPRAALKFSGQPSGSTTFIEGVKIDLAQSYGYDAIEIGGWDQATPGPDYTIQNVRLLGAMSTTSGLHADLVQFYGSCRNLRIDKLTGTSQYQGCSCRRSICWVAWSCTASTCAISIRRRRAAICSGCSTTRTRSVSRPARPGLCRHQQLVL